MKRKSIYKPELLLISVGIVVISQLVGYLVPDSTNAAPIVVYQWGMLQIFSGIMGLIGSGLFIIWFIMYIKHSRQKRTDRKNCSTCGAIVPSIDDKFCRKCGAELKN